MKLVAIGGHTRNIGKTALACSIIRATRQLDWTALKVTQFGHGVCSTTGEPCHCSVDDPEHPFAITRERDNAGRSDTARMLQAGARDVYWVRVPMGRLDEAMPDIERLISTRQYVLVESNSILEFLEPDVYLSALHYGVRDFKASSRFHMHRADAFVIVSSQRGEPVWENVDASMLDGRPVFAAPPPDYRSGELLEFLLDRLGVRELGPPGAPVDASASPGAA